MGVTVTTYSTADKYTLYLHAWFKWFACRQNQTQRFLGEQKSSNSSSSRGSSNSSGSGSSIVSLYPLICRQNKLPAPLLYEHKATDFQCSAATTSTGAKKPTSPLTWCDPNPHCGLHRPLFFSLLFSNSTGQVQKHRLCRLCLFNQWFSHSSEHDHKFKSYASTSKSSVTERWVVFYVNK